MERSIIEEENNGRSDSTHVSMSRALIKIDSISIDLSKYMDKNEPGKCEHFSIREYVAEMRKKDRRICLPFDLDDNNKSEDMLPPLHVAKFRWWRCQNCLKEVETGISPYCEKNGFICSSTCSHMNKHSDAIIVLSDTDQALKMDKLSNVASDDHRFPPCSSTKEKKLEVGHSADIGHQNGSKEDGNKEIRNLTSHVTESNPCCIQESHTDDSVAVQSKGKELVESCERNRENDEVARCLPPLKYPKFLPGKLTSADYDQQRNLLMNYETPNLVDKIDMPTDSVMGEASRLPSLEFEERDSEQNENSSGLIHRKTQKVRLLTDLLGAKGKAKNDKVRTEGASSSEMDSLSAVRVQVPDEGNKGKALMGPTRKRKIPRDEDWKPVDQLSFSDNWNKKARVSKGDREKTNMGIKIVDPESQENAFTRVGLHSDIMSHWNRINRSAIPDKGKHKVIEFGEGVSPVVSFQNVSPKKNQTDVSAHDAFPYKGLESYFRSQLPLQQIGRNSILRKKKNKVPRVEDTQASFMPPRNITLGVGSTAREDSGITRNGPEVVKFRSARDASAEKGLDLSLNSFTGVQRTNMKYVPEEEHFRRKDVVSVGEASVPPDPFSRRPFDLNESIARKTSFLRKMQKQATLVEDRSFPLHQKLGVFGNCNNEKTIEVKETSEGTKKYSNPRADKVFEGKSDDIPMDVVELLAKIRYERLHEFERSSIFSERTNDQRNGDIFGCSKVHGNKSSHMRKCETSLAKNGMITEGENVGPMKQKPVDYFSHFNRNHLNLDKVEKNAAFTGFTSFMQSQEKLSGGVQSSASGSIRNRGTQNFRPNGDNAALEAYNTCQNGSDFRKTLRKGKMIREFGSESSERAFAEFPLVDRQGASEGKTKEVGPLDIYPNETIPAMQLLSLMDAGVKSSTPLHFDGKSKFFEKPLYPCDHHPKVCLDGNSKFLDKPFPPYNHHSKEFSVLGNGVYKAGESSRHPLSSFGKSYPLDKSCECSPSFGTFSSLFQENGSLKRATGFGGQVSPKSREREMGKDNPPKKCRGPKSQSVDLKGHYGNENVWPTKNIPGIEICKLNRNPADFTIPNPENEFMISSEDLGFGKKIHARKRSSSINVEGRKRQRATKITGVKENSNRV